MRKPKAEHGPNHERWLVSYADFITLMFAFFVVMFSASTVSKKKLQAAARAVEQAFSGYAVVDTGNVILRPGALGVTLPPLNPAEEASQKLEVQHYTNPQFLPDDSTVQAQLAAVPYGELGTAKTVDEAYEKVREWIARVGLESALEVARVQRGVKITALSGILFPSGGDKLLAGGNAIVDGLAGIIAELPNYVLIEGFTDDQPITGASFDDNVSLSQARADYVRSRIIGQSHLPAERFIAIGRGEMAPVVPNDSELHRARNRRVELTILRRGTDDGKEEEPAGEQKPPRRR